VSGSVDVAGHTRGAVAPANWALGADVPGGRRGPLH
jgi:hypothetical protein